MKANDRRAVLEGIAYGDDARVTPSDRLRALDQLQALDGERRCLCQDDDVPLDAWDDAFFHDVLRCVLRAVDGPEGEHDPEPLPAVDVSGFRRVRELVEHELARRIERRVEPRAHELAQRLYETRAFTLVQDSQTPPDAPEGDEADEEPSDPPERPRTALELPDGLTLEDVARRGWPERDPPSSVRWRPRRQPWRLG